MQNCRSKYVFAYNGQERTDEKAGKANYYTAKFWEYDPRKANRDNPDPVIKYWQSPYAVFGANPIWKIDPLGNDDYYNKAGKWVGNDGSGNALRLTTAPSIASFSKRLSEMGIDRIKEMSPEIIVQSDEQVKATLKDIKVKSYDQQVERKAYIILNTDTRDGKSPTLSIEMQPIGPVDDLKRSKTYWDTYSFPDENGNSVQFKVPKNSDGSSIPGNETKVIVGQIHGHPDKKDRGNAYNSSTVIGKTSSEDKNAAGELGVPVHAVDYTDKVQRINPGEEKSTSKEPGNSILVESLEISGGKR